jgi:uncharacterized protein YdeI (YjbR/CyaY-like superfamily)
MGKKDPRVDAYIKQAAPFAQPILTSIRETVHGSCPDVEEAMKWSFPHFMYKGMLCGMASFKQHAAFGFWKGSLVTGGPRSEDAMGHFGRITKLSDLPSKKVLAGLVRKAAALNDQGVKVARAPRKAAPKTVTVPAVLTAALKKNKPADAGFDALSPSHKREYIEWITEAKTEETRARRLAQAVEWVAEGKSRNWKYERRPPRRPTTRPRDRVGS